MEARCQVETHESSTFQDLIFEHHISRREAEAVVEEKKVGAEAETGEEEATEVVTRMRNRFLSALPNPYDVTRSLSSDRWLFILHSLFRTARLVAHSLPLHLHQLRPRHSLVAATHQTLLVPVRQALLIPSSLPLSQTQPISVLRSVLDLYDMALWLSEHPTSLETIPSVWPHSETTSPLIVKVDLPHPNSSMRSSPSSPIPPPTLLAQWCEKLQIFTKTRTKPMPSVRPGRTGVPSTRIIQAYRA
jgi:hypothetical protein